MAAAEKPRGKGKRAPQPGTLTDPHNSFFAFTFGQKEHAAGLLRALLPPEVVRRLAWDTLTREPVSFIDARLRWLHSDLLFSVRALDTGEEVLIYLLVEHQSTPHPLMAYRVMRYVTRVWDDHLKKHRGSTTLPLVIPAVVYHGEERWTAARSLRALMNVPAPLLAPVDDHVPQSGYLLVDLRNKDAERLVDEALTVFGRVALWAMEIAGDDEQVLAGLRRMSDLLSDLLAQPDGRAALGVLLRYILATHQHIDQNKLRRTVADAIEARAGDDVVTVYEQLIEQGRQKGRAEGIAEGRAEGIAEGIAEGRAAMLLDQLVAKFGQVPAEVAARVKKAPSDELTTWGTRLLTAATLAEVLASPRSPARRRGSTASKR